MSRPDDAPGDATPGYPNFARMYGHQSGAVPSLSPRMAYSLWQSAILFGDTWRGSRHDPGWLLDDLPLVARPYAHGEWLDRFIGCFDALADRLARGEVAAGGLPTCTGEELALHLVIDLAEAYVDDGVLTHTEDVAADLPDGGVADEDFDRMRDALFNDSDILLLFDPSLDGVEDPEGDVARSEGFMNLHPADWFTPFFND